MYVTTTLLTLFSLGHRLGWTQDGVHPVDTCQEFRGQTVLRIEAVHNLRKVRMYLNVLSLRSTS